MNKTTDKLNEIINIINKNKESEIVIYNDSFTVVIKKIIKTYTYKYYSDGKEHLIIQSEKSHVRIDPEHDINIKEIPKDNIILISVNSK